MEQAAMGRVVTEATIENIEDRWAVKRGLMSQDQVRSITVTDALVDTGATTLSLPTHFLKQLGLEKRYTKRAKTSTGLSDVAVYEAARLTIQGREWTGDVVEVADDVPVLIGQIPLEFLDLVVDLRERKLIGNPAHGGEHVLELL